MALEPAAKQYLEGLRALVARLPRGVFVWNIEPYDDIEKPPAGFRAPLSALYTVAAGFKPNRLLETHGFTTATRIFSATTAPPAWTTAGSSPSSGMAAIIPASCAGSSPASRPATCTIACGRARPGRTSTGKRPPAAGARRSTPGAAPVSWLATGGTTGGSPTRFLEVDLLSERRSLIAALEDDESAAFWFSNAFFSLVSNWLHPASSRRAVYRGFLAELAAKAPRLWLYGSSSDNVAVNHVQAGEYERFFAAHGGDELKPGRRHHREMLF